MSEVRITTDIFIRYLFGSEKNRPILLSFINAVLQDSGFPLITEVEVKNPFNLADHVLLKESILDVKARDSNGRFYDIEVQVQDDSHFTNRTLYYWAKNYVDQLQTSGKYGSLQPVICINILNFTLLETVPEVHSCFVIRELNNPELALNDHFQVHFIEMKKFRVPADGGCQGLNEWLWYLKNGADKGVFMEYAITDENIRKAEEEYEHFVADPALKEAYDSHMKWVMDNNSRLADNYDRGFAEGTEKGFAEGTEKGFAEGEAKGEAKALIETALKMKNLGISVELIKTATGLTDAEILNI